MDRCVLTPEKPSEKFKRRHRLLEAKDFKQVFDHNRFRASGKNLLMLAAASPTTQNSRLGIVVAKKNVRRAIDRNRIKRLTREYFRQQVSPRSSSLDFVVLARQGMGNLNNCDVRMALKSLFDSVLKKASHEKLDPASQSHVH